MLAVEWTRASDLSIAGMLDRLEVAAQRLRTVTQQVSDLNRWDDVWLDHLEDPPQEKRFGTSIAHVITHSMHHRAQILYMLRRCDVSDLPEGDVFSWEQQLSLD